MSRERIQKFLENQIGTLSKYQAEVFGVLKPASDIIYDAAQYYQISPKFLIVLLQKEQSLVTDSDPSQGQYDWATGYGVCDSCSKSDPDIQKFKGFFNQLNWASKRNRQYINEAGRWQFQVGGTYLIDGVLVTMENQATVNLYTYTPHIHGNELFHDLWHRWFTPLYPDGSLLQVSGQPGVYLIKDGKKRPFWSKSAFLASYNQKNVIKVSQSELDIYDDGKPIKYAEYSLLQGPDGNIYLITDNQKRLIESEEVFRNIGFNPEEVVAVEQADLDSYSDGEPVTLNSIYPTGTLLQSKQTGGVTFVQNGVQHPIWSKEILKSSFPGRRPSLVDESEMIKYPKGDPVLFRDGDLVTSPGTNSVYVISNGQKRPIASADAFNSLGYKWANIIRTNDKSISIHPDGPAITIE